MTPKKIETAVYIQRNTVSELLEKFLSVCVLEVELTSLCELPSTTEDADSLSCSFRKNFRDCALLILKEIIIFLLLRWSS